MMNITYFEVVYPQSLIGEVALLELDLITGDFLDKNTFFKKLVEKPQILLTAKGLRSFSGFAGPESLEKIKSFLNKHAIDLDQQ
jgi:hypothetical protein